MRLPGKNLHRINHDQSVNSFTTLLHPLALVSCPPFSHFFRYSLSFPSSKQQIHEQTAKMCQLAVIFVYIGKTVGSRQQF